MGGEGQDGEGSVEIGACLSNMPSLEWPTLSAPSSPTLLPGVPAGRGPRSKNFFCSSYNTNSSLHSFLAPSGYWIDWTFRFACLRLRQRGSHWHHRIMLFEQERTEETKPAFSFPCALEHLNQAFIPVHVDGGSDHIARFCGRLAITWMHGKLLMNKEGGGNKDSNFLSFLR